LEPKERKDIKRGKISVDRHSLIFREEKNSVARYGLTMDVY
jgi:hypothetical protein